MKPLAGIRYFAIDAEYRQACLRLLGAYVKLFGILVRHRFWIMPRHYLHLGFLYACYAFCYVMARIESTLKGIDMKHETVKALAEEFMNSGDVRREYIVSALQLEDNETVVDFLRVLKNTNDFAVLFAADKVPDSAQHGMKQLRGLIERIANDPLINAAIQDGKRIADIYPDRSKV